MCHSQVAWEMLQCVCLLIIPTQNLGNACKRMYTRRETETAIENQNF